MMKMVLPKIIRVNLSTHNMTTKNKIKEFISKVDIITYEFENIPINILNEIDKEKKVLPKPEINK